MCDELPEAFDVRRAEDPLGPALGRIRDAGPVDRSRAEDDLGTSTAELSRACAANSFAVDSRVEIRLRVAADAEFRAAMFVQVLELSERPRRRPFEDVVGRVLEHAAADELVSVKDVDSPRAGGVGRIGRCPGKRCVLDQAADVDVLALADVEADADRELGVSAQPARRS